VRIVPRLCEVYPGICLTTEEKARKNLSQGNRRLFIFRTEPVSCRWFAHARVVVRDVSCLLQRFSNSLGRARWKLAAELVLRKHSAAYMLCLIGQLSVAQWIQDHATHTCTTVANDQLDAQIFTFITILYMYMFRAISCSASGGQIVLTLNLLAPTTVGARINP